MKQLKGSFSVEAALIIPLLLFIMLQAVNTGIRLTKEVKEMSAQLNQQDKTDVIGYMYHLESIQELIGEINGN